MYTSLIYLFIYNYFIKYYLRSGSFLKLQGDLAFGEPWIHSQFQKSSRQVLEWILHLLQVSDSVEAPWVVRRSGDPQSDAKEFLSNLPVELRR